jgi:LPXTG-site transpeptidase (sortase) family protein
MQQRLGGALIVLGVLVLAYAGLWQLGLMPGSRVTLPAPVALEPGARLNNAAAPPPEPPPAPAPATAPERPAADPAAAAARAAPTDTAPVAGGANQAAAAETPGAARAADASAAVAGAVAVPVPLVAPDAADRAREAALPPPGYAVRLAIPAIKLDTPVKQGGIVRDASGNPTWQTLPFVAVHYGDLTALVGARGNAVIAGHVVTLNEGNVFRFLYQLDLGDQIQVWDQHDAEHDFQVVDVKLVPPSDTSVMAPTPDPTLTLITCGGTFDPRKREFSDRLIVVAKPLHW